MSVVQWRIWGRGSVKPGFSQSIYAFTIKLLEYLVISVSVLMAGDGRSRYYLWQVFRRSRCFASSLCSVLLLLLAVLLLALQQSCRRIR
jgi:hypothetical protein